jgi:hypothetical protein
LVRGLSPDAEIRSRISDSAALSGRMFGALPGDEPANYIMAVVCNVSE